MFDSASLVLRKFFSPKPQIDLNIDKRVKFLNQSVDVKSMDNETFKAILDNLKYEIQQYNRLIREAEKTKLLYRKKKKEVKEKLKKHIEVNK